MIKKLRVGTRGSRLALWQAEYVVSLLGRYFPDIDFETVVIKTQGDKILDVALSKIGDKGLFTKEIEIALLDNQIDMAVHSMKDLPTQLPEGIEIGAVLERENPRDVLVSHRGYSLAELPPGARVGTSSLRRISQLRAVRPDLELVNLRGNVETRIRKMKTEGMDAIILAYAGVKRMGYLEEVTDLLSSAVMLPAVGQGAIGIEIRQGDTAVAEKVKTIHHEASGTEVTAERAFMRRLEGGCQVPIACQARAADEELIIDGLVASLDGKSVFRSQLRGQPGQAEELGKMLAAQVLTMGADTVLEEIRRWGEQSNE
ncbi:MAG: hydroxymethylbilane synthase [Syntrophomonadaceae bacterium]|jgi:hydroxymethylbilane synthase|nr:hydroxymethylbilane synthase [Syntrophomonadaceae bacterium]